MRNMPTLREYRQGIVGTCMRLWVRAAGGIRSVDQRGGEPGLDVFDRWDRRRLMTQAWTATTCGSPAKGSIIGAQPYWTSWTVNSSGLSSCLCKRVLVSGSPQRGECSG